MHLGIATILSSIPATEKDGVALASQIIPISDAHKACCEQYDEYLEFMEKMFGYTAIIGMVTAYAVVGGMIANNHGLLTGMFEKIGLKKVSDAPENKKPEFSEEDRMQIIMNLMARQSMYKAQLDGDNQE